ncbi:ABC transporter permease [Tissierella creatinophila]|uniref:ABC-2 family transporter protein n=1 Tax=Tissierella creatinophila DSM 6911 TaxID=1123403 RepID=A0A1U7M708_TISCR|nr:ABC transporter permease [Tissierella creatinophila]OLS03071.1 ABC-2 family transporter protein [Tissierella creatinophila DSM 6911]
MKNIWRNSLYIGKNMFRDISFSFWGLIYPIILVTFFYIAFNGLTNPKIETINLGIENGNDVASILEDIDILNVVEMSKEDAKKSLENEEIDGFVKEDLTLLVDRSGRDQTIIKSILDQIKQTVDLNEPLENLDFEVDYLKGKAQESNSILVIFYSLIAMVSTYGIFAGTEIVNLVQANLTPIGARLNVTPIRKSTFLTSGVLVGLFINILSNVLLLLFIKFVLKLDLIRSLGPSSLFILFGNLFGISLGIFIGASNKKSQSVKTMISITVTLFLSFLSGLMSPDIKVLIDSSVPLLGKINPIAIITNNLYRINLLNNTNNLSSGILLLIAYSLMLMFGSYIFLRRREYDSI